MVSAKFFKDSRGIMDIKDINNLTYIMTVLTNFFGIFVLLKWLYITKAFYAVFQTLTIIVFIINGRLWMRFIRI